MLIKRFSLFASLWLIPSFALWYVSYQPVLLPALQTVLKPIVSFQFVTEQARLHTKDDGWEVATTILTPDQPTQNANRIRVQNIKVEKVVTYTLGFPLLWAFLLANITHRPKNAARDLIIGNAALFISIVFFLSLKIFLLISTLISEPNTNIYIAAGIIKPAIPYPNWLIVSLQLFQNLFAYLCVFFIPIFIWFFLVDDEDKKQFINTNKSTIYLTNAAST